MPPQASLTRVFFGSLGVGGNPFCPEALAGSIFTLGLNIGLPVIFMGVGVTLLEVQKGFQDLINNSVRDFTQAVAESATVRAMRSASLALAQKVPEMAAQGLFGSITSQSIVPFLSTIGNIVIQAFLNAWPGFAKDILIDIAAEEIPLLFPVIGNAMRLLNVAADLAQIMETIGEVVTNPDG